MRGLGEGGVFCEALRRFNNWRWYYWSLIAYYTSKYGRDVTIIEKGEFVSGTSSRCDGNILAIDKDPGFDSQMSLVSQKLVTDLSEELEHSFEYRAPGSILVCESDEEMEATRKNG